MGINKSSRFSHCKKSAQWASFPVRVTIWEVRVIFALYYNILKLDSKGFIEYWLGYDIVQDVMWSFVFVSSVSTSLTMRTYMYYVLFAINTIC